MFFAGNFFGKVPITFNRRESSVTNIKKDVSKITPDSELQRRTRELGNGDATIETQEVDSNRDGYLDLNKVTRRWSACEFRRAQDSLFLAGLIYRTKKTSCDAQPWQQEVVITTELEGNAKNGIVIFVRQKHGDGDLTGPNVDPIDFVTALYQHRILRFLFDRNAMHVFHEGIVFDMPPQDPLKKDISFQKALHTKFPPGWEDPRNLTKAQVSMFLDLGAAAIYPLLFKPAFLHRTEMKTTEEVRQLHDKFKAGRSAPSLIKEIFKESCHVREKLSTKAVMDFLRQNRGSEAVLVYGANHQFKDDFSLGPNTPVLVSIDFYDALPAGAEKLFSPSSPFEESDDLDETAGNIFATRVHPQNQHYIVVKAKKIPAWAFQYILSEQDQIVALDKLELDSKKWKAEEGTDFKKWLLKCVRSEKVARKIRSMKLSPDRK